MNLQTPHLHREWPSLSGQERQDEQDVQDGFPVGFILPILPILYILFILSFPSVNDWGLGQLQHH
jgi:hypothetical protein